jgi:signal peptidase I
MEFGSRPRPTSKANWRAQFVRVMAIISAIGVGHIFIETFCCTVSIVDGPSMTPNFRPGARIFTEAVHSTLQRGDVVVVAGLGEGSALKRLIGMPGETIYLWDGNVYINGALLREPYLTKATQTFPAQSHRLSVFELGEDQYFVLGDNRLNSTDSRLLGPLERNQIKRRALLPDNEPHGRLVASTFPGYAGRRHG